MVCKKCGTHYSDYEDQCPACGSFNPGGYSDAEPEQKKPEQKKTAVNANYRDSYNQQQPRRKQPQQPRQEQKTVQYQRPVTRTYVPEPEYEPDYHEREHVSTWGWIGRWLIMCIPIVNIVMLFVWAFGGTPKRSLKTWARARLLMTLIGILVVAVVTGVLVAMGYNFEELARYANLPY